MARTLDIASTRAAGFALLKPAEKPKLDATRIVTLSGTLAVNLLAMGLLMLPLTLPPPAIVIEEPAPPPFQDWIKRKVEPPVPVDIKQEPVKPRVEPTVQLSRPAISAPTFTPATPVVTDTGTELAVDTALVDASGPTTSIEPAPAVPAPTQLRYVRAPAPDYPLAAMRAGVTGTVMLQVLVDVDGRPLEVTILQGSGNRALDAAARTQVLRRWRFEPAMKNGQAVQAIGMVPIEFKLQ